MDGILVGDFFKTHQLKIDYYKKKVEINGIYVSFSNKLKSDNLISAIQNCEIQYIFKDEKFEIRSA